MTSNKVSKLRTHINWKILKIIDLLDNILRKDTLIKDRFKLYKIYHSLFNQKNTIEKHYKRYGPSGYTLYLTDDEHEVISTLSLTLISYPKSKTLQ